MFVRSKDPSGRNVTMLAYKIAGFYETPMTKVTTAVEATDTTEAVPQSEETVNVTIVILDGGDLLTVADSERVIRSKIEKAFNTPSSVSNAGDGTAEMAATEA